MAARTAPRLQPSDMQRSCSLLLFDLEWGVKLKQLARFFRQLQLLQVSRLGLLCHLRRTTLVELRSRVHVALAATATAALQRHRLLLRTPLMHGLGNGLVELRLFGDHVHPVGRQRVDHALHALLEVPVQAHRNLKQVVERHVSAVLHARHVEKLLRVLRSTQVLFEHYDELVVVVNRGGRIGARRRGRELVPGRQALSAVGGAEGLGRGDVSRLFAVSTFRRFPG
ncbi:PAS domain S-box protein [Babesia caballi]|uniref:PAS domain S-box protein n=1 Tax=Babesia caballi TaxID=5871 RepID=A0AAV4LYE8_BABCB|nr:PAS domain S-box protein [Babesia caballi]